jgi:hypothetical protein
MECEYCCKTFRRKDNLKRHQEMTCSRRGKDTKEVVETETDNSNSEMDDTEEEEESQVEATEKDGEKDIFGYISDNNSIDSEEDDMSKREIKAWRELITESDLPNFIKVKDDVSELWNDNEKLLKVVRRFANEVHQLESNLQYINRGNIYSNIRKVRNRLRQRGYSYVEATLSAWEKRKFLVSKLLIKNKDLLNNMYFNISDDDSTQP